MGLRASNVHRRWKGTFPQKMECPLDPEGISISFKEISIAQNAYKTYRTRNAFLLPFLICISLVQLYPVKFQMEALLKLV